MLQQWAEAGRPDGTFKGWLSKEHPDLAAAFDPKNRGKLPREDFGLTDFVKDKLR